MLIAEFARRTGLSRDTIRFYVRKNLLQPAIGSATSNRYRTFAEADVERVAMIRLGRTLGFTLREIETVKREFDGTGMTAARQAALMRERVRAIDAQIASLQSVRHYLLEKTRWLDGNRSGVEPTLVPYPTDTPRDRSAPES